MQKIIITTKEKKKKQLKEKNPFDNIKIMTLKELEAIYPYKYTEKTLDYIITNYHVLLDIAKIYLEQIIKYPVEKITGEKGEFLTKLKKELINQNLLEPNELLKEELKKKEILIYLPKTKHLENWLEPFSIKFENGYYSDQQFNSDLSIIPTRTTQFFFDRFSLKWFKCNNTDYKVLFKHDNVNGFIRYLKGNISYLDFEVYVNNSEMFRFSDVKVNQVYNFTNKNPYPYLSKNEFVNDEDVIDLGEYRHKLFGLIRIFFDKIENENAFCFKVKPLSTTWRYYISNKNLRIKNILKITSDADNLVFLKHKDNDFVYSSMTPVALSHKYNFAVVMTYETVDGITIEESLPLARGYSNCVADKNFFSDQTYTVI